MADITRIIIENFQSHKNTILDFQKGLNVIVGPSDQGKSAIVRAIKWVLYNEPRGMDFIRHGTSIARVTIEMSNGYIIIRERSKSKNKYSITHPEKTVSIFEGFGNEVPEEVIKAHGIPKVILDSGLSSCLNIGDQLEAPFLISETGSMKAKAIGRLTGVHVIDNAIKDCLIDLKRENQNSERLNSEFNDTLGRLEEYKELEKTEFKINASEMLIKQLEESVLKCKGLQNLKNSLESFQKEYNEVQYNVKILSGLNECELNLKNCEMIIFKLNALRNIKMKLDEISRGIDESSVVIQKTQFVKKNIDITNLCEEKIKKLYSLLGIKEKLLKSDQEIISVKKALLKSDMEPEFKLILENLYTKKDRLSKVILLKQQYSELIQSIVDGEVFIEDKIEVVKKLSKKYADVLRKAGRCPVCSSEISETKIGEILEEYKGNRI